MAWMLSGGVCRADAHQRPDLMWRCASVRRRIHAIYCYGSAEATLALLETRCGGFPCLAHDDGIAPFRTLTAAEDAAAVGPDQYSGAAIVARRPGCPKQERWMAEHRGRINAVMTGWARRSIFMPAPCRARRPGCATTVWMAAPFGVGTGAVWKRIW